ncbi:MAG TPA: helix-turn-helix transcriptional regulator [Streptosporangiaceae bacterium]|nr:helix-turn-helix transcriptional regulator [Streptosporangiaceae bacterium]
MAARSLTPPRLMGTGVVRTMTSERDPDRDPAAFLGAAICRARVAAGFETQDQLARKLGFERSVVAKAESGERPPSPAVASALEALLPDLGVSISQLSMLARKATTSYPRWFADWLTAERQAVSLRSWEPLLLPGLLQTPEYARALFRAWQMAGSNEELEELVTARMARQAIFDRADPPKFWAVIDETVLYRCIGGPAVMRDQLAHLAEMTERPRIAIQVIPADAGAHIGLLGAFAIAGMGDNNPGTVYLETPDEGQTTKNPAAVAKVTTTFDTLRSEALPRRASRDLVMKVAEERWH